MDYRQLPRLNRADQVRLTIMRIAPNATKIPLFVGLMVAAGWLAAVCVEAAVMSRDVFRFLRFGSREVAEGPKSHPSPPSPRPPTSADRHSEIA